jgi:hypothetical protein
VRCGKVRSDSGRGGQPMGEHGGTSTGPGTGGIHGVACQRPAPRVAATCWIWGESWSAADRWAKQRGAVLALAGQTGLAGPAC